MKNSLRKTPEWHMVDSEVFHKEIVPSYQPAILRGFVKDWPAVKAGMNSAQAMGDYLKQFDNGDMVETFVGPPSINGRIFYQHDLKGLNFDPVKEPFNACVERLLSQLDNANPSAVYLGATSIAKHLPGFLQDNANALLDKPVIPKIWMSNVITVGTHNDFDDNIACVVSGRRNFTFFPPEQVANLYIGPIDFTIAGRPVSMVSLENPDFEQYPRFKQALAEAQVAELEPGDAVYIPSLWWHHVQSLEKFNVLINYWWSNSRAWPDSPYGCLVHGLLTIRGLPLAERQAWLAQFEHYVFQTGEDPAAHLPPEARGVLGKLTPSVYRTIRAYLMNILKI